MAIPNQWDKGDLEKWRAMREKTDKVLDKCKRKEGLLICFPNIISIRYNRPSLDTLRDNNNNNNNDSSSK